MRQRRLDLFHVQPSTTAAPPPCTCCSPYRRMTFSRIFHFSKKILLIFLAIIYSIISTEIVGKFLPCFSERRKNKYKNGTRWLIWPIHQFRSYGILRNWDFAIFNWEDVQSPCTVCPKKSATLAIIAEIKTILKNCFSFYFFILFEIPILSPHEIPGGK